MHVRHLGQCANHGNAKRLFHRLDLFRGHVGQFRGDNICRARKREKGHGARDNQRPIGKDRLGGGTSGIRQPDDVVLQFGIDARLLDLGKQIFVNAFRRIRLVLQLQVIKRLRGQVVDLLFGFGDCGR